jgi:hypothetical protein
MLCAHKILFGACAICLAEAAAPPANAKLDLGRFQTVRVDEFRQEFEEPHPPTDEAGVLFHPQPVVSSAITESAGFLEDDSAWYMISMMRPSSGRRYNLPQRFYGSDWS